MCGIAGLVLRREDVSRLDAARLIQSTIRELRHRGPDTADVVSIGRVCLGGCRLSILDISERSNQPMRSSESGCILVFNGEIFNYVELREELRRLGHEFTTTGDTETVLHAYEEWGVGSFGHLNGMFAFALHDPKRERTCLVRDRYGIKPLYYAETRAGLAFASEPVPLLKTGLVPTTLDMQVVRDYLRYGITDYSARTFFAGVRQVCPGSFLITGEGEVKEEEWYRLPGPRPRRPETPGETQLVQEFRTLLDESIRLRLRSDVPVGVLLSGGLDSSAVVGFTGRLPMARQTRAFMVSFPESSVDESAFGKMAAAASGVPITIESGAEVDQKSISRCIQDQGEPVVSPSMVAQWLIMRAISEDGFRVALTGQGADELLAGYEYMDAYALGDLLAAGHFVAAARYALGVRDLRRLPALFLASTFVRLPAKARILAWSRPWLRHGTDGAVSEYEQDFANCKTLREMVRFHIRRRLPELLRYEDRNSMSFSVETRQPFLDHNLVEFALRLPDDMLVGTSGRKRILRLATEGVVPDDIRFRRVKIGFQTPEAWLRTPEFRSAFVELCRSSPAAFDQIIDFRKARRLVSCRSSVRRQKDLWRIYNLLAWYESVVKPLQRVAKRGEYR